MFRNALGDVNLFGGRAAATKPSFRPGVEALEQRLVLDNSGVVFQLNEITQLAGALTVSLQKSVANSLDSPAALAHAERQARAFQKLESLFDRQGGLLLQFVLESGLNGDPQVQQAVAQTGAALELLHTEIYIAAHHHRPSGVSSTPALPNDIGNIPFFGGF
jgi:hypothetical protein